MSFFKKRNLIIFAVILIIAVSVAAISKSGNNAVSNALNTVITPVETLLLKITSPVSDFFEFVGNMKEYQKENEQLKLENQELMKKVKDVSEYMEENERLKKLLGISYDGMEYNKVAARVVAYESDNWFSYISIDKGEKDGIKVSDTVVTAEGLLGQVSEVGYNWAKISTIINQETSAGVRIIRTGEIGIVEGDAKLSKSNKCKLSYLLSNATVNAGDILETSGLGGIFPPGLMVGKITDVRKDNMGRLDYAVIEPFISFDNLYEVVVITDWTTNNDSMKYQSEQEVTEDSDNQNETVTSVG